MNSTTTAPRKNYGITRRDQPSKSTSGYHVRIKHSKAIYQHWFPDKACGGKAQALREAMEWRDAMVAKLPLNVQQRAAKPKRRTPKSGVEGVWHVCERGKYYWLAEWRDRLGHRRRAKYSIERFGNKTALEMAILTLADHS